LYKMFGFCFVLFCFAPCFFLSMIYLGDLSRSVSIDQWLSIGTILLPQGKSGDF
jgi:hypothetical protein